MQEIIGVLMLAVIGVLIYLFITFDNHAGKPYKTNTMTVDIKTAMSAIAQDDISLLKSLIDKGLPIDATDASTSGNSLLHCACLERQPETVKYLLDKGANINIRNMANQPPLLHAFLMGSFECVITLLQRGAENITTPETGNTILHDIASDLNIHYYYGLFVNMKREKCKQENPILNEMIEAQLKQQLQAQLEYVRGFNVQMCKYLLKNNFDLTRKNKAGQTVMDCIRLYDNRNIGLLLATTYEDVAEYETRLATALSAAVMAEQPDTVTQILGNEKDIDERETNTGETALYRAAFNGNTLLVKLLIERGANVNIGSYKSTTPLMVATILNHTEIIQTLIDAGADTEIQNYMGETPLFKAASMGNKQAVQILLTAKADPNSQNLTHNTPLMRAAKHGYFEIVKMLVEHGADINYSYKGISVMDKAWSSGIDELKEYIEAEIEKNKAGKS